MTAQSPETIILDDEEHDLQSLPLEPYLDASGLRQILKAASDVLFTSLWRGYIGHWRIADDALWLDRIAGFGYGEGDATEERDVDLDLVFPGAPQPIMATWFSGKLNVPMGEKLMYVHMGWQHAFERERIIHMRDGRVTKIRDADHRKRFLAKVRSMVGRINDDGSGAPGVSAAGPLWWLTDAGIALVKREFGWPLSDSREPPEDPEGA